MLGDYETAASTLRLLASDTKADRAYKAYAGVQEALGAAAVLSGAPPSEAAAGYKEAVYRYAQVGPWAPGPPGRAWALRPGSGGALLARAPHLSSCLFGPTRVAAQRGTEPSRPLQGGPGGPRAAPAAELPTRPSRRAAPFPACAQLTQANPRNREGVRYATRAVLLLAEFLRAQRLHGEANQAYMKGHFQAGAPLSRRSRQQRCTGRRAASRRRSPAQLSWTKAGRPGVLAPFCVAPSLVPPAPAGGQPEGGAAAGAGGALPAGAGAAPHPQVCLPPGAGGAALRHGGAEGPGAALLQAGGAGHACTATPGGQAGVCSPGRGWAGSPSAQPPRQWQSVASGGQGWEAVAVPLAGLRRAPPDLPSPCRQVLGVYSGRRWALIEEHLHDVLGRQARDAGDAPAAAQHFMAMLSCPQNTPYCQRCVRVANGLPAGLAWAVEGSRVAAKDRPPAPASIGPELPAASCRPPSPHNRVFAPPPQLFLAGCTWASSWRRCSWRRSRWWGGARRRRLGQWAAPGGGPSLLGARGMQCCPAPRGRGLLVPGCLQTPPVPAPNSAPPPPPRPRASPPCWSCRSRL